MFEWVDRFACLCVCVWVWACVFPHKYECVVRMECVQKPRQIGFEEDRRLVSVPVVVCVCVSVCCCLLLSVCVILSVLLVCLCFCQFVWKKMNKMKNTLFGCLVVDFGW